MGVASRTKWQRRVQNPNNKRGRRRQVRRADELTHQAGLLLERSTKEGRARVKAIEKDELARRADARLAARRARRNRAAHNRGWQPRGRR